MSASLPEPIDLWWVARRAARRAALDLDTRSLARAPLVLGEPAGVEHDLCEHLRELAATTLVRPLRATAGVTFSDTPAAHVTLRVHTRDAVRLLVLPLAGAVRI